MDSNKNQHLKRTEQPLIKVVLNKNMQRALFRKNIQKPSYTKYTKNEVLQKLKNLKELIKESKKDILALNQLNLSLNKRNITLEKQLEELSETILKQPEQEKE